ncbi:type VII secretion protein EccCa [Streptomyces sp. NPDC019224]|uniref:type VII secretion protein EccCa n=1 Tax=Streptomyces sp. NPDC019224 TaxID=3154484 RepID=UPI00340DCDBE
MSRIVFHRPARVVPPELPTDPVVVAAPPQPATRDSSANWLMLLMPLLSSISMAAYMIVAGRRMFILLGISFVLLSIGLTVGVRMQMRSTQRKKQLRARDRYLDHLTEVRKSAWQVASDQRLLAAWRHPSPYRLRAVAAGRRRVWERRPTDSDFLMVRLGTGRARLATPVRLASRNDPTVEYDARAKAAADRLVAGTAVVLGQPLTVDLSRGGVVSVLGPAGPARGVARALLTQIAVLHAPDDVRIAVVTGGAREESGTARSGGTTPCADTDGTPPASGRTDGTAAENDPPAGGDRGTPPAGGGASGSGAWEWAKWLPHTHDPEETGEAGVVPLVAEDFAGIADRVTQWLTSAHEQSYGRPFTLGAGRGADARQRLLVLLDGYDPRSAWARTPEATALLTDAGADTGLTVVCVVEEEKDEPTRADVRIRVAEDGTLTLESRTGGNARGGSAAQPDLVEGAVADRPSPALCEAIARALAPLTLSDEGDEILARTMSLPELLGVTDLDTFDPEELWAQTGPDSERLLCFPVGFDAQGDPLTLDLKEAAHGGMGPHGLVIGATGSGKSELLRTLVSGLAATHSPDLLSFVLVDFKGGATFAGVTGLPHVAGLITNLVDDLALVDRVRDALQGELQRRQALLRDAGNLDSVREYQALRAAGRTGPDDTPLPPLPYLFLIVDEFAELLTQRPEFVDLFVQIGRVGRSLGIHLLLAGQRMEEGRLKGLESNLSYRVCLRTLSAADSRTVIGTPDAYKLPPLPGSAYLKVSDTLYERFRVAHVSGPHDGTGDEGEAEAGAGVRPAPFELRRPPEEGTEQQAPPPRPRRETGGPTEMQVLVEHLTGAGQPVHQVWLPPLPAALPLDALTGPATGTAPTATGNGARTPRKPSAFTSAPPSASPSVSASSSAGHGGLRAAYWPDHGTLRVPIGVADLPVRQQQVPVIPDFSREYGHLALVGAPRTGKSTFLRTLMLATMITHTPEQAQFICLDFGGGALQPYEAAPHVSGVAGRPEPERARRALAEVVQLIDEREHLFRELRVDSADTFRRRREEGTLPPGTRAADVFLLVDNWASLRTELQDGQDNTVDVTVLDIATRGLGVGVHLVLTANRWAELRTALRDSIAARLELRLNEPGESEIDRRAARRFAPVAVPGRGLAPGGLQFQVALPRLDGRDTLEDLAEAQSTALDRVAAAWRGPTAPAIRTLPERLTRSELADVYAASGAHKEAPGVPVGLGENDLRPVLLDLSPTEPHLLVYGDSGSGKSVFLRTWLAAMTERYTAWETRFILIDYRRSLLDVVPDDHLGAYAGDAKAARAFAEQVAAKLAERLPPARVTAAELRARSWWEGPEFYVVADDYDLVATGRDAPLAPLVPYLAQARETGLHVIAARRVSGHNRTALTDPVFSQLPEIGASALILSGNPREGALVDGERAQRRAPGRAVLLRRKEGRTVVQIAVGEENED